MFNWSNFCLDFCCSSSVSTPSPQLFLDHSFFSPSSTLEFIAGGLDLYSLRSAANACIYLISPRMCSYGYCFIHRQDLHLTKIVFTIVYLFLVLNLPRLVLGVFEISRWLFWLTCICYQYKFENFRYSLMVDCFNSPTGQYFGPQWQLLVDMVARYLAVLNSSINFIIYCVAGKQFRTILAEIFHIRNAQVQLSFSLSYWWQRPHCAN